MLVADRKVLEANLAKGTLTIQYRLITLYSHNLSALGTNAALIANLSVLAIIETHYPEHHEEQEPYNSMMYQACCILGAIAAFFAFTQSSMEVIWVPSKALSGSEDEEVMISVQHMKNQQRDSLVYGSVAGTFLMIAMALFILSYSGPPVAVTCAVILIVLYVLIFREGRRAFRLFDIKGKHRQEKNVHTYGEVETEDADERERTNSAGENVKNTAQRLLSGGATVEIDKLHMQRENLHQLMIEKRQKLSHISCKGSIWTKNFGVQSQVSHKCFRKAYMVLENGGIDIYKSKKAYEGNSSSDNPIPICLATYEIETNSSIIKRSAARTISATGAIRNIVMGTDELSFKDNLKADFNVQYATSNLKFSLLPKASNEMEASENLHFMAEDDETYSRWLQLLKATIAVYRDIDRINAEIVHSRGTTNVKSAIAESSNLKSI